MEGRDLEGETLGSRIRKGRVELRISQAKLAGAVGLSVRAISQVEAGILNSSFMADHLPAIAAELGTTVEFLKNGELASQRLTREELGRLRKEGIIRSDADFKVIEELATDTMKKRRNANIPLSREEILFLIELVRGADGL